MALSFIPFAFPGAPGVRCAFQTRDWGVSEGPYGGGNIAYTVGDDPLRVSANRLDLAASLELAEIAELDQIHGDTLVFDPPASPLERFVEPPAFPKGDGLATDKPGIGLIIKTADCQPVLVAYGLFRLPLPLRAECRNGKGQGDPVWQIGEGRSARNSSITARNGAPISPTGSTPATRP